MSSRTYAPQRINLWLPWHDDDDDNDDNADHDDDHDEGMQRAVNWHKVKDTDERNTLPAVTKRTFKGRGDKLAHTY